MSNIMSLVKLQNRPSRNGFDLSRKVDISAKAGELLPFECIECIPGDKFQIKKQHFTRTLPVNTAAYTRIREYYDWFFVPTHLLWDKFGSFVTQMTDNQQKAKSIYQSAETGTQHPYFTTVAIANYLRGFRADHLSERTNFFGYDRPMLTSKLLDYLGYGAYYGVTDGDVKYPRIEDMDNSVLNPFPLLAYQKIYQDYFRNSQWENGYAPACNINYMNSKDDLEVPVSLIDYTVENMFDLRYCNWNKDYFMGVLPNSQYGDEATVDLSSILSFRDSAAVALKNNSTSVNQQVNTNSSGYLATPSANSWNITSASMQNVAAAMGLTPDNLRSAFTILALRQAEASQKWREITQSAQQDYKNQIEAHFGVSVSDAYSDRCKFIDGQVSTIDINEVLNQNLSATDSQADIRGKGVGSGEGYFNFSTDVHGYLVCIYHCLPILDYQTTGIKKINLKSMVTDYAIPEFDKTGMVKIPFIELTSVGSSSLWLTDSHIGYAPQYYEYKTRYDEVKGAFAYGGLNNWVSPFDQSYIDEYLIRVHDLYDDYSIEYHFFKINPAVLNPIFVNQLSSDIPSSELSTDQFLINCAFDIKAIRLLDRNGLPY